jgi:hypothetical protein
VLPLNEPANRQAESTKSITDNGIGSSDSTSQDGEIPSISAIMDTRLPYNMEYVVSSLLRVMVAKRMLSLNDAQQIMKSGESYLH